MKAAHRVLGLVVAGLVATSGQLEAQQINFQGTSLGCFYQGNFVLPCTSSLYFLQYVGSTFDVTTLNGKASIGSAATPNAPGGNVDNLGSFALQAQDADYDNGHFLLDVFFAAPISGPNQVFSASLDGAVNRAADGGVNITFAPSTKSYLFLGDGGWVGTFDLTVNDVSVTPTGMPVALTGKINVTATPEPGTTALFATGLAGLVPAFRMRRRKNNA